MARTILLKLEFNRRLRRLDLLDPTGCFGEQAKFSLRADWEGTAVANFLLYSRSKQFLSYYDTAVVRLATPLAQAGRPVIEDSSRAPSNSEDNVLGDNISVSQSSYIAMGIARGARPTASEKHKAGSSLDESRAPLCGTCLSSCHLPSCLLLL